MSVVGFVDEQNDGVFEPSLIDDDFNRFSNSLEPAPACSSPRSSVRNDVFCIAGGTSPEQSQCNLNHGRLSYTAFRQNGIVLTPASQMSDMTVISVSRRAQDDLAGRQLRKINVNDPGSPVATAAACEPVLRAGSLLCHPVFALPAVISGSSLRNDSGNQRTAGSSHAHRRQWSSLNNAAANARNDQARRGRRCQPASRVNCTSW